MVRLPLKQILTFEGKNILLIHHALDGQAIHRNVQKELDKQIIDIVVFGHTHMPFNQEIDGILFFNTGGAGRRRFNYPLGVGIIEIKDGKVKTKIETLN